MDHWVGGLLRSSASTSTTACSCRGRTRRRWLGGPPPCSRPTGSRWTSAPVAVRWPPSSSAACPPGDRARHRHRRARHRVCTPERRGRPSRRSRRAVAAVAPRTRRRRDGGRAVCAHRRAPVPAERRRGERAATGLMDGGPRRLLAVLVRAADVAARWLEPGGSVLLELGGDQPEEMSRIPGRPSASRRSVCHRDAKGDARAIEARAALHTSQLGAAHGRLTLLSSPESHDDRCRTVEIEEGGSTMAPHAHQGPGGAGGRRRCARGDHRLTGVVGAVARSQTGRPRVPGPTGCQAVCRRPRFRNRPRPKLDAGRPGRSSAGTGLRAPRPRGRAVLGADLCDQPAVPNQRARFRRSPRTCRRQGLPHRDHVQPFTKIIEWAPGQCVRVLVSQYMAFLGGTLAGDRD